MDQVKIGKFIAQMRKSKNLTQEQMAQMLGVSNKTVSRWETGKNPPDASLFNPICDLLGISLTEFFNGEKIEENQILEKAESSIVTTVVSSVQRERRLTNKIVTTVIIFVLIIIVFAVSSLNFFYSNIQNYNYNNSYYITGDYKYIYYDNGFGKQEKYVKFRESDEYSKENSSLDEGIYIGNVAEKNEALFSKSMRDDKMYIIYEENGKAIIRLENDFENDYFYTNDTSLIK